MQLPSALLSVTVLLAQAASGFRLQGSGARLRLFFGYATVREGIVGFNGNNGDVVDIIIKGGHLTNSFMLQFREPEWYLFRSSEGITRSPLDLDAPFGITDGGKFEWTGNADAKWFSCANGIYLSVDGRPRIEWCLEVHLRPAA